MASKWDGIKSRKILDALGYGDSLPDSAQAVLPCDAVKLRRGGGGFCRRGGAAEPRLEHCDPTAAPQAGGRSLTAAGDEPAGPGSNGPQRHCPPPRHRLDPDKYLRAGRAVE
jgi:hypothetical protein